MTGPAVDLVAVGVARRALAAIAAEHPELTGPTGPVFYVEHLPEIATMTRRLDPNATGESTTVGVRLSPQLYSAVDAERVRLAAIVPGSSIGMSDAVRSLILRALATPAQTAPAAPAAPAPMPVVASPAAPVAPPPVAPVVPVADSRQLPLLTAAAPVVATHTSTSGLSVATVTGNDNGVLPAAPKHTREPQPAAPLNAAAVGARLRALRDDEIARGVAKTSREWSLRPVAARAGVSPDPVAKLINGEPVKPAMLAKVAAILPAE